MHRRTWGAFALGALLVLGCAHDVAAPQANGTDPDARLEALRRREPELKASVARDPGDGDAHFDLGVLYQVTDRPELALAEFEAAVTFNPDDWHSVAKLIQINQALSRLDQRERRLEQLFAMYRSGKVVNPRMDVFIREQFHHGTYWVMVLQCFELEGDRPVRYSFQLLPEPQRIGGQPTRTISLGSYDFTNNAARRQGTIGPNERLWHLDGYWPNGTHAAYAFFRVEPTYDAIRTMVIDVIDGKATPTSTLTVGQ